MHFFPDSSVDFRGHATRWFNVCTHRCTGSPNILLVDDDAIAQESVSSFLRLKGYVVESAATGTEALTAVAQNPPILMVLDLGLPDCDGLDVCRHARQMSEAPIIALSAGGSDVEKISAFECGADDYVTRPFCSEELLARIRVALRRGMRTADDRRIERGALMIDVDIRRVCVAGREVRLTPKEFKLLTFLARYPNRVVTREAIVAAIWGTRNASRPTQLWALVRKLRRKIEPDPSRPQILVSEPWVGYRIVATSGPPELH